MARNDTQAKLTSFDLMLIRANGRTEAELEVMASGGFGFGTCHRYARCLLATARRFAIKLFWQSDPAKTLQRPGLAVKNEHGGDGSDLF